MRGSSGGRISYPVKVPIFVPRQSKHGNPEKVNNLQKIHSILEHTWCVSWHSNFDSVSGTVKKEKFAWAHGFSPLQLGLVLRQQCAMTRVCIGEGLFAKTIRTDWNPVSFQRACNL